MVISLRPLGPQEGSISLKPEDKHGVCVGKQSMCPIKSDKGNGHVSEQPVFTLDPFFNVSVLITIKNWLYCLKGEIVAAFLRRLFWDNRRIDTEAVQIVGSSDDDSVLTSLDINCRIDFICKLSLNERRSGCKLPGSITSKVRWASGLKPLGEFKWQEWQRLFFCSLFSLQPPIMCMVPLLHCRIFEFHRYCQVGLSGNSHSQTYFIPFTLCDLIFKSMDRLTSSLSAADVCRSFWPSGVLCVHTKLWDIHKKLQKFSPLCATRAQIVVLVVSCCCCLDVSPA